MKINTTTTIDDIEIILRVQFPYLRFEFFKIPAAGYEYVKQYGLPAPVRISDSIFIQHSIEIDFSEDRKIIDLKKEFHSLGLTMEISRKTGKVWVRISLTEDWSLGTQNRAAEYFGT